MLKINLLPNSARKTGLSQVDQLHRAPILWVVGGGLFVFILLLFIPLQVRRAQLNGLNAKIQALQPRKLEVDRLQSELQQLRAQEEVLQKVQGGIHNRWAKRLNVLSDVTPEGVWYTELNLDRAKGLVIQGSAIAEGGSETVRIGRLVQDLKANPDFSSAVKDIQIESIKRVQDGEVELVQFTLTCAFHEEAS